MIRNTSVRSVLILMNPRTGCVCTKEANMAEVTQHCENTSNGQADYTDT